MHYRSLLFSILVLLLILAGCGKQSNETPDPPADSVAVTSSPAARIAVTDLAESAIRGNAARALATLPPAEQVQRKPQPNRHDSTQVDTVRTLYYTGLISSDL